MIAYFYEEEITKYEYELDVYGQRRLLDEAQVFDKEDRKDEIDPNQCIKDGSIIAPLKKEDKLCMVSQEEQLG